MNDQSPYLSLHRKHFWQADGRSQGVVEFAIALPILLMLLFGIIDFSLLFSAWLLIQNMSRQAVRYAVTGEYYSKYYDCDAACEADTETKAVAQDQARLQSIHDVAKHYMAGLMVNDSLVDVQDAALQLVDRGDPGYLQITICSGRVVNGEQYVYTPGRTGSGYSDCTLDGVHQEDPGGPGDTVLVMIDFNHPYITPFLNQIWPMVHLASVQQGVVEVFRVSREISVPGPPNEASNTPPPPTNTFTSSKTFTPSETFTASDTVTITNTPTHTETYTLTSSPTPTATIDCSLFSLTGFTKGTSGRFIVRPYVQIGIQNDSGHDTTIVSYDFDWDYYASEKPTQTIRSSTYNNTAWPGYTDLPADGSPYVFQFTFNSSDSNWDNIPADSFGLSVVLDNGCTVSVDAQAQPTRTSTMTSTNTFTRTNTGTFTDTSTHTNTVPTSTFTYTLTRTNTVPTSTFTHTNTYTNTVPTSTFTHTSTYTNTVPTSTFTYTRTYTNTVPTSTFTSTHTHTFTSTSTHTFTFTFTNTQPPATNTRTYTPTNTSPPTNTLCLSGCTGYEPPPVAALPFVDLRSGWYAHIYRQILADRFLAAMSVR